MEIDQDDPLGYKGLKAIPLLPSLKRRVPVAILFFSWKEITP